MNLLSMSLLQLETAIAVGKSAGLTNEEVTRLESHDNEKIKDLAKIQSGKHRKSFYKKLSVALDGECVAAINEDKERQRHLEIIFSHAKSVIAAELSPLQKRDLVSFIKRLSKENVILAVGDGGNDVSMIQEAHVGVGIVGKVSGLLTVISLFRLCCAYYFFYANRKVTLPPAQAILA